jgi:hypothetical protein
MAMSFCPASLFASRMASSMEKLPEFFFITLPPVEMPVIIMQSNQINITICLFQGDGEQ